MFLTILRNSNNFLHKVYQFVVENNPKHDITTLRGIIVIMSLRKSFL